MISGRPSQRGRPKFDLYFGASCCTVGVVHWHARLLHQYIVSMHAMIMNGAAVTLNRVLWRPTVQREIKQVFVIKMILYCVFLINKEREVW
jgi:hypothetical protein